MVQTKAVQIVKKQSEAVLTWTYSLPCLPSMRIFRVDSLPYQSSKSMKACMFDCVHVCCQYMIVRAKARHGTPESSNLYSSKRSVAWLRAHVTAVSWYPLCFHCPVSSLKLKQGVITVDVLIVMRFIILK